MNDDTVDLTPIMSVANRISDFGPVQIEVRYAFILRASPIKSLLYFVAISANYIEFIVTADFLLHPQNFLRMPVIIR